MAEQSNEPNRQVIDAYYQHANAGDWDAWCDLFADDVTLDEQLAGRIEGLETLRPMMAGMGQAYAVFRNVPKEIVLEGDRAAVVAHISARAAKYPDEAIEAEVMNFFRLENGKIVYMANFHDSAPFAPFVRQLSE